MNTNSKIASQHYKEYEADLISFYETGKTITNTIWLDNDGKPINLLIAIQDLGEPDPWIDRPLTLEEERLIGLSLEEEGL